MWCLILRPMESEGARPDRMVRHAWRTSIFCIPLQEQTEAAVGPAMGMMNDPGESFLALPGESDQMRRGRSYTPNVGSGGRTVWQAAIRRDENLDVTGSGHRNMTDNHRLSANQNVTRCLPSCIRSSARQKNKIIQRRLDSKSCPPRGKLSKCQ